MVGESRVSHYYRHGRPELVAELTQPVGRVLDAGCGVGNVSAAIKADHPGAEIWGVEMQPEAADVASRNPALFKVICGDFGEVSRDLPRRYFSHVVAGDILEHLADPWTVLERVHQCLVPGGQLVCSIPNIRNISFLATLVLGGRFRYRDSGVMDRTHLRFFARKDIDEMLRTAGFTDVRIGPVRPKRNLLKQFARLIFRDFVVKGFKVTARTPG